MSRRLLLPTLWLVLAALAAPAFADDRRGVDFESWIEGPIRYIARKDEMRAFRALERDSARALFIERFWTRRDPSPDTLTNEFRQLFWERVQQANTNFLDSTKPGWMTDRGKVHVLYGAPNEVEDLPDLRTDGLAAAGRGLIRWIYSSRPGERMDVNPIVVVPFVRDTSGEYRLSYDPKLSSVFFDADAIHEDRLARYENYLDTGATNRSELSVMLDLGRLQEVPPQAQVLIESVETSEGYETDPLGVDVDRYTDPRTGESIAVVSVAIPGDPSAEAPAVIARFAAADATRGVRLLGEDSFRFERVNGERVAQGRVRIDPGQYTLTVVVADPERVATGLYRDTVTIGGRSDRMRVSDTVWAAKLEPLAYASLASYDEAFIVGAFHVVPFVSDTHVAGDTLRLFYEIYDTTFPVSVSYQIEGEELDGRWIPLGTPLEASQQARAQGWEMPTSPSWPEGAYRVHVVVTDADGRSLTLYAPFRLAAADPS